jgi:type III secretion protein Q
VIALPRFSAAEAAALNRLHRRRAPARIALAGRTYLLQLPPWAAPDQRDEPPSVEFEFDGRLFWLAVGGELREALVAEAFPGVAAGDLPDEIAAALLEVALEPVLAALERALNRHIVIRALVARPPPEARRVLPLRLEPAGGDGLPIELALRLDPAHLETIAACFDLLPPEPAAWDGLPVLGRCEVGSTRITAAELRGAAVGDLLVVEQHALRERRVALRFASMVSLTATIEGSQITVAGGTGGGMADPERTDEPSGVPLGDLEGIEVTLTFQLGRVQLTLAELRAIGVGQSFDLGRDLQAPVDILANGRLIGRGALIQIEDRVGVRIGELFDRHE